MPPGVRAVVGDGLAVVVADLRADSRADVDAVSHLDVLCELVCTGPVLPLRFGTVAPDDDAVRAEVLRAGLAPQLDRLDGLVEVRVQLEFDERRRERGTELLAEVGVDRVELEPAEDGTQNWAVLVAFDELSALEGTIAGLAGVTAHLLGPLPAYSFLDEPSSRRGF